MYLDLLERTLCYYHSALLFGQRSGGRGHYAILDSPSCAKQLLGGKEAVLSSFNSFGLQDLVKKDAKFSSAVKRKYLMYPISQAALSFVLLL